MATPRLTTVQAELSSSKQAGHVLKLQHVPRHWRTPTREDLEHAHEELRVLQKKLELCREVALKFMASDIVLLRGCSWLLTHA